MIILAWMHREGEAVEGEAVNAILEKSDQSDTCHCQSDAWRARVWFTIHPFLLPRQPSTFQVVETTSKCGSMNKDDMDQRILVTPTGHIAWMKN